jgi:hypothetical protein
VFGVAKSTKSDTTVTTDRRRVAKERRNDDRRSKQAPVVVVERRQLERRAKVVRRRQIDPTTCERDYTDAEVEFMNALDDYKRKNGRMFPTCSEILEVIAMLGYEKRRPGDAGAATEAEATFQSQPFPPSPPPDDFA